MAYLTPKTWAGSLALNSDSLQTIFAPKEIERVPEVDAVAVGVMSGYPAYTGLELKSRTFALWVRDLSGSLIWARDQLARWFAPELGRQYLVAEDDSGASRRLLCQPLQIYPHPEHPRMFIITMEAHNPIWEGEERSASTNLNFEQGSITASVGGNIYALPTFYITPQALKGAETVDRLSKRFEVTNRVPWKLRSYPIEVTGGGWDTTGIVASGQVDPSGHGFRVVWRSGSVDRWVDRPNTASTKIWIVVDMEGNETVEGYITWGASGASAPTVDSSREPIFDHENSTNGYWIYDHRFGSDELTRPISWVKGLTPNNAFQPGYDWAWVWATGGSDGTWSPSNPWAIAGVRKFSLVQNRYDLGVGWRFDLPVGMASIRVEGKYRLIDFSTRSRLFLQYSATSLLTDRSMLWIQQSNESASWTPLGPSTFSFSPCGRLFTAEVYTPFLEGYPETPDDYGFYISGASVVLTSYPTVSTSPEAGYYALTASIVNLSTSQGFALNLLATVGETIEINCAGHYVRSNTTGCYLNIGLQLDEARRDWLTLAASTENEIQYTEYGVVSTDFKMVWRDRWI